MQFLPNFPKQLVFEVWFILQGVEEPEALHWEKNNAFMQRAAVHVIGMMEEAMKFLWKHLIVY